ncbi:hypothetical protein MKK55_25290 [Methylobacterium sp. J-059]|uniref:hypothetical protein n=1 Tax=Methylobacterium sp. J-059 TaxID=2836643 RepID=UPI001FBAC490|nr:hypothetical protein [Methylobacterium sp. J-059]MCJ2042243.1 hypothetical protein [Methylobacterium sp. J-059]
MFGSAPVNPEAVAYHEAAHAVVAVKLGMVIESCTVIRTAKHFAHVTLETRYEPPATPHKPTPPEVTRVTNYARMAYAGHFAEKKKFGPSHAPGSEMDTADVEDYAADLYPEGDQRHTWKTGAIGASRQDVEAWWPAIEMLAQEILTLGDRTHADVLAVIARTGV